MLYIYFFLLFFFKVVCVNPLKEAFWQTRASMFVVEAERQFPKERGGTKSQLNSHGYNLVTVVCSSSSCRRAAGLDSNTKTSTSVLESEQRDLHREGGERNKTGVLLLHSYAKFLLGGSVNFTQRDPTISDTDGFEKPKTRAQTRAVDVTYRSINRTRFPRKYKTTAVVKCFLESAR